ncbi:MAG: hypothetical protein Q9160_007451 [Pyrenula sp. 1 TL-2023]
MDLIAEAKAAEQYADAFRKFKDNLPDAAKDITALVAHLYAIGHALRDLHSSIRDPEYGRNLRLIEDDLTLVRESLKYTLSAIFRKLGTLADGSSVVPPSAYALTWKEIDWYFRQESRMTLLTRLQLYHRFLRELGSIMLRSPYSSNTMISLKRNLDVLLDAQSPANRLADQVGGMSLGKTGPTKPRSFERQRPPVSTQSPTSPNHEIPPWAPEVSEASTTTSTHSSGGSEIAPLHWACNIFQDMSATPLKSSGGDPGCYGEPMEEAKIRLDAEYEQLFEIRFHRALEVGLYHRESDQRARVLCKCPGRGGGSLYYCLPLNTLRFKREGSTLKLCRRISDRSKVRLWATLKFSTIERLVVYFCTLLALRAQDAGRPIEDLGDGDLEGEVEYFGGRIEDDGYEHALRVLKDRSSKAIRLQASVLKGEMKNAPVWTAFIHNHLKSRTWISRPTSAPCKFLFSDLRRHVFSSRYSPPVDRRGQHVISFITSKDAEDFAHTIRDLARLS